MPPAVAAAGIAAAATIGGGLLASKAQKKAAQTAADSSLAVAQANNALQEKIYGENKAILSPYSNMGLAAGNALTDLLLGTHTYNPQTAALGPAGSPTTSALGGTSGGHSTELNNWALGAIQAMAPNITRSSTWSQANQIDDPYDRLQFLLSKSPNNSDQRPLYNSYIQAHPQPEVTAAPAPGTGTGTGTGTGGTVNTGPTSALDAFDRFRQGTNYQWRFNQGLDALQDFRAANGTLDSGATRKAIVEYGQNFASNELANYMDLLARQQATGLSAASAVAGVANNFAGNIAASNTAAANAAANAALARGQASANMWGNVASGIGQIGGAIFQNSNGGFPSGSGSSFGSSAFNSMPAQVDLPTGVVPYLPGGF